MHGFMWPLIHIMVPFTFSSFSANRTGRTYDTKVLLYPSVSENFELGFNVKILIRKHQILNFVHHLEYLEIY